MRFGTEHIVALAAALATFAPSSAVAAGAESFVIEKEFEAVTCGSSIKLANKATGYRLHSHEINYGTGSGQQSVTGFPRGDDPNSLFVTLGAVPGTSQTPASVACPRGKPIRCGQAIRLQHQTTAKYLHSHGGIPSPISSGQEVSAYQGSDTGDNWKVVCADGRTKIWKREQAVALQHIDTGFYLGSSSRFQYQNVIVGQIEVAGRPGIRGDEERWVAQEGIYFAST